MKFSELWLREWINPSVDTNALVDKITMSGFKSNISDPVSFCFNGVVIGNILNINIHPKNFNLQINKIDIGNNRIFNVISKRKYKKNVRVAVALVGAKLSNNVQVKCIDIQGELSEGILCSFSSLGITYNKTNDIIELPIDAPLGEDLKKYLQLNDNIIDIAITSNRGDCLNVMGIAHDIGAMYRSPIRVPKINAITPTIDAVLPISIDLPCACPQYFSRIIKNIDPSISTPLWMKEKLRRSGIQSINVIDDIINYVLLELGQPIHVFDLDSIQGSINIRLAKEGEELSLYNKNKVVFTSDILIVSDQIRPLGIAGVLVGDVSIVNKLKTSNLFLESAFFDASYIIRSSRRYGLITCSSYRYERHGINPNISKLALERATFFLIHICGGVSGPITSIIYDKMLPKQIVITLHRNKLNKLIGYSIQDSEVVDILIHIGCNIKQKNNCYKWEVLVPIWRFDIKIEEDLIEEIIRLYGYDKITGLSLYSKSNIDKKSENVFSLFRSKILLMDLGYQEVITYSFINPEIQNLLYPDNKSVILLNPLTSDMSVMRLSLWIGLLKTLLYNQRRQQRDIRLFESGTCFIPDKNNINKIYQHFMLSGIITGSRFDEHWNVTSDMLDFYDIKGDVESLLEINGKLNDDVHFKNEIHSALHPGQSAAIFLKKEHIGYIGVIHPILEKKLNLKSRTFVFELFWEKISQKRTISKIIDVPKFPINRRDISVIISENISSEEIIIECKKIINDQLIDIKLFDVYQGQEISKGLKSLSIRLYIYDKFHTLEEQEIKSIVTKCISGLQNKFQASLRKK